MVNKSGYNAKDSQIVFETMAMAAWLSLTCAPKHNVASWGVYVHPEFMNERQKSSTSAFAVRHRGGQVLPPGLGFYIQGLSWHNGKENGGY